MSKKNYRDIQKYKKAHEKTYKKYYVDTRVGCTNYHKRWDDLDSYIVMFSVLTDKEIAFKLKRSIKAVECQRNKIKKDADYLEYLMVKFHHCNCMDNE